MLQRPNEKECSITSLASIGVNRFRLIHYRAQSNFLLQRWFFLSLLMRWTRKKQKIHISNSQDLISPLAMIMVCKQNYLVLWCMDLELFCFGQHAKWKLGRIWPLKCWGACSTKFIPNLGFFPQCFICNSTMPQTIKVDFFGIYCLSCPRRCFFLRWN